MLQHGESKLHADHPKIQLPVPARIDDNDGLPLRTLILDLDETLVHTEFDVIRPRQFCVSSGLA